MAGFCRLPNVALTWLLLLPGAWAQTPVAITPSNTVPTPGDNTMGVAKAPDGAIGLRYVSVLGQYQAYTEQAVTSWPQANATVERIGGWRAYAKEAVAPPAVIPAPGAQP